MSEYRQKLVDTIIRNEGSVNHMYLDTRGHVTCGVGLLLGCEEDALKLSWTYEYRRTASPDEVRAAYSEVKGSKWGQRSDYYKAFCPLRIPSFVIRAQLFSKIEEFENGLSRHFNLEEIPDDARIVLVDMAYNLGLAGLVGKFPRFCEAMRGGDWAAAARECWRGGIGDRRNDETREMLYRLAESECSSSG